MKVISSLHLEDREIFMGEVLIFLFIAYNESCVL